MADDDITLDGKPLHSLRVADLKAALEQRNLPKSGQKPALLKRLKGALMLENLQKSSGSHGGLQPNSQIGEEMSQNSFIKQYLAQQQELLQQRLEREAQQEAGANMAMEEDDDQSEDDLSFVPNKATHSIRTEDMEVEETALNLRKTSTGPDVGAGVIHHHQGSIDAPRTRMQRAALYAEQKDLQAPSPPRAVASLSVRVLGQPDQQEPDSAISHALKKGGCTSSEPCPSYPAPRHSDAAAGVYKGIDDDADDDSKNDEEWGPSAVKKAKGAPPQMAVNMSSRSKRKLQPPQHIPPPQAHPAAMQHPTPPPSPPPDLFPLPDTPKQSPPDGDVDDDKKRGSHDLPGLPTALQRQNSESSSHSSSPEAPAKRGHGPLSMLVHKMEQADTSARSEKAGSSSGPVSHNSEQKTHSDEREVKEDQPLTRLRGKPQTEDEKKMETTSSENMERSKRRVPSQKQVMMDSDSASSSDSDSFSSSSARGEPCSTKQLKKLDRGRKPADDEMMRKSELKGHPRREVSESGAATMSEAEPESESSMAEQPAFTAEPANNDAHLDQGTTPKTFSARKISLTGNKMSPATAEGGAGESEASTAGGRKRRWGSSTAVTTKKPSISITTESLKSLIPDIKVTQDAVVDLHPEELQLSGDEDNHDNNQSDLDKGLKIRRTVTQVVPGDSQENGQVNEEEEIPKVEQVKHKSSKDAQEECEPEEATETPAVTLEVVDKKVTPSDSLVRRSISQQKSGVSVTIDEPIHSNRPLSPPRGKISNIIHVTNLVRPFTLGQLKDLLKQTGSLVEDGFWIDKIKSHCYVTYTTKEEAAATRAALHGVKWPQSNPKILSVDFCEQDELDFHKGILKPERQENQAPLLAPQLPPQPARLPPLMPERERDRERDHVRERDREREQRERAMGGMRDFCAEREREMLRRERTRGEREWDRDKIREFARPGEHERRSRSRERRRRERAKSKERKSDRKEKADEPPAKMLDDLFLKTKAAPCIYWLPLTEEQVAQRILERAERQKERERKLKEQKEEEEKKREEEKKERLKGREKEVGVTGNSRGAGRGPEDRGRDRDGDKRRDSGHRPRRPSVGPGNGRRSRSHSNPRDRRR